MLAGIPPIEIVVHECKRVHSDTCQISLGSGKAPWVRCDERRVTLLECEKWLSGSSKGEWTHLLIHNLEAWLERGHGQKDFI